jgi:hypothetical protein
MYRSPRRRNFASFVNIAHLHVRFARQASERDSQLGATITPHAATAGAIDPDVLRHREPDHRRRVGVAKGSTAHVLFESARRWDLTVRVERFAGDYRFRCANGYARPKSVSSAFLYPPWGIAAILRGG